MINHSSHLARQDREPGFIGSGNHLKGRRNVRLLREAFLLPLLNQSEAGGSEQWVQYILRRLGYMVVTLVIVTILGYIIIELPPGSYVDAEIQRLRALGGNLAPDQQSTPSTGAMAWINPPMSGFFIWISGFVRGDFGEAFAYNLPVEQIDLGPAGSDAGSFLAYR